MTTRIARWGHSLAVRIPKNVLDRLSLTEGSEVEVSASNGQIVVTQVEGTFDLNALVDRITDDNRHDETDWGLPQGREVW